MNDVRTLIHWIESLNDHQDRPAVLAFDKEAMREWSYGDLSGHVRRLANQFAERGLKKGDIVSLLAMPSPEWVAACLAVIRIGAVISPLDVQLADDVLQHVLEDSQPRLIITTSKYAERLEQLDWEAAPENILLEDLFSEVDRVEKRRSGSDAESSSGFEEIEPDDTAVLFYTSGTTGPPKGVPLTHENLAFELKAVIAADVVGDGDRALLPLPLHHVYPFVIGTLTPLAMGLPIIFPHSLTGPQLVRAIEEGGATVVVGVPRLYRALLSGVEANAAAKGRLAAGVFHGSLKVSEWLRRYGRLRWGKGLLRPLHKQFGPQLRMLASGGSPLDPDLAWKLEAIGWQVAIGYGLTETSPLITLNPPGTGKLDSVGQAIPGVEIRLDPSAQPGEEERPERDEAGRKQGEILVRGPNVFAGYRNLPEKTDEAFTDGWFRTGDLGAVDEDGYVYVHGRASTMIVTEGGENVQPDEVEEAYAKHRAIREIGVLDRDGNLVGLVVPEIKELRRQGGDGAIEKHIRQAIRERAKDLPSYQRLADVAVTRESLPRTRLGKIQRHVLEQRYERAKSEDETAVAEAGPISVQELSGEDRTLLDDPTAKKVWDLLARKYPDQRLTPDTSPQLDLGVDSMAWLDLSLELRRRAGVELDEEAIGRIETVRDLLQEVAERSEGEAAADEDWLENPEAQLNERQRKELRPRGRFTVMLSRWMFSANRLLMRGLFRLETRGKEHLPNGSYILAPNHVSYLDAPAVAASLDNRLIQETYWGGWMGLMFSNPLFRAFSRVAQVLPIDPSQSAMSSIMLGAVALERGRALVWFPEGERSPDGKLQPFRPGLGLLLERYDVPVVPVLIEGTYEALPMDRRLPRLRKVVVTYGRPRRRDELEEQGEGDERRDRIVNALHDVVAEMANETTASRVDS